jgi:signal transduction histidine kinase
MTDGGERKHLEEVAALGLLLNAIAHDLNNQLTNLLLGADQFQYSGGKQAVDLMVGQAQRIAGIMRAVQRLGQRNMSASVERCDLGPLLRRFADEWQETAEEAVELSLPDGAAPQCNLHAGNILLALSLCLRPQDPALAASPPTVQLSVDRVPRTAWSSPGDTVSMAVLRIRRGSPPAERNPAFKEIVDHFFDHERSPEDVGLMAAWEVVRKVRGRMELLGGKGLPGQEIVLMFPLADAA